MSFGVIPRAVTISDGPYAIRWSRMVRFTSFRLKRHQPANSSGRITSMSTLVRDALKFFVLLALGGICTVFSIACLPVIGLGTALLSVQTASWVKSAQWRPVPLSALLDNLSYSPHADWSLIQSGIEHLLSLESGPILIGAAGLAWALALILFDQALKKWRPTASVF